MFSFQCWPARLRHGTASRDAYPRHVSENAYPLTSSELHDILRRCRCSSLESLEVVYKEDNSDGDVLLHMAHVFPALRTLKLFQYRWSSDDLVDIVSTQYSLSERFCSCVLQTIQKAIRRSLSHPAELRTLYIHHAVKSSLTHASSDVPPALHAVLNPFPFLYGSPSAQSDPSDPPGYLPIPGPTESPSNS